MNLSISEELLQEKKNNKETISKLSEEVKSFKQKNAKLLKAYKDLESKLENESK